MAKVTDDLIARLLLAYQEALRLGAKEEIIKLAKLLTEALRAPI